jgi:hypothetical protein
LIPRVRQQFITVPLSCRTGEVWIRATNLESGISTGLLRMAVGLTITAIDPLRRMARSIAA